MAKKSDSGHTEIQKIINSVEEKYRIHTVYLVLGRWALLFAANKRKLMIARALNECVNEEELKIKGYLITESRIYLVLYLNKIEKRRILTAFGDYLQNEIDVHFERIRNRDWEANDLKIQNKQNDKLFTKHPVADHNLIRLITGKKVKLPYHDAQLERLKEDISFSRFCSAIDYRGEIGPVIINMYGANLIP